MSSDPTLPQRGQGVIRTATPDDADALFRMAGQLATSAIVERGAFETSLSAILADPNHVLLVAESDAGVVGYVHALVHPAFHANGNVTWVEELHVDSDLRGHGLGHRLMAAMEEWAEATARVTYHSVATRRAAGFYLGVGYRESATWFKKPAR